MYATQNPPIAQAQVEFQLIEDRHGFILGRLFIPAGVKGSVKGSLVRKLSWGKSTTLEFIPRDLAEVERCYKQYAASNLAGNRIRTVALLQQLRGGRPIVAVEPVVVEVKPQPEFVAIADPWEGAVEPIVAAPEVAESKVVYLLPPAPVLDIPGEVKTVEVSIDDYLAFTVKELKAIAISRGVKFPSKIKKSLLAELLLAS